MLAQSLSIVFILAATLAVGQETNNSRPWRFAVSGDSRNCGDVVMPAIAASALAQNPSFYWHLGDFRKMSDFDEDIEHEAEHSSSPLTIDDYELRAWDDFIQHQLAPFGSVPVFLAIGNHELVFPHTREMYVQQFADWLDTPVIREQRLKDDPKDHLLMTYYHWGQNGVDFITMDNGSLDQFDSGQLKWFERTLNQDVADPQVRTIVVGMHRALPDSISAGHSMNESAQGTESGRRVYKDLLDVRDRSHKRVYVLASHSHYYMADIFETAYWKNNGGVLPGWIVGTAGAQRYALPPDWRNAKMAETNVYGYLMGTVQPEGEIQFEFHPIRENDVPPAITNRYRAGFVDWCFDQNSIAPR
jgi:hypothetical protein